MANKIYNKQVPGFKSGGRVGLKDGSLKPVDKSKNPGLAKLPIEVRNKMGYAKKGGRVGYFLGKIVKKKKPETKKEKSIKEKILPSKKKKRLEELKEMLK